MSSVASAEVWTHRGAVEHFSASKVRWMLDRGHWQRPFRGVIVTHSGPLSDEQHLTALLFAHGPLAVLGGATAAALDGLVGYPATSAHILIPAQRSRQPVPGAVVHRSQFLGDQDVHPLRTPRRTRLARSIVDAAAWAPTDWQARSILAAGVQQRLVRPDDLLQVVERLTHLNRRPLIRATVRDVTGGSHSGYELDFLQMCRRFHLPMPSRQIVRRDAAGRARYFDAEFDPYDLVVEVDGSQHMEVSSWWKDMMSQNEVHVGGKTLLRYPGFVIRDEPAIPARQIADFMARVDASRGAKCGKVSLSQH